MNTEIKARPTIALTAVESSQIHAIGHHPETNTLAIQFKNYKGEPTSTYHYENFTADHFDQFKNAESIGAHFGKHIKPCCDIHPFVRVS